MRKNNQNVNRRVFLRDAIAVASGSVTLALAGCISESDEEMVTTTPAEIPPFHATNAGILSDIETLERAVHEQTNEFRVEEGHIRFGYNEDLAKIARYHSRNMAKEGFFAHNDPEGRSSGDRVDYFGYPDASISENLARWRMPSDVASPAEIAEEIVSGWKDSPPHRSALLATTKIVAGVGSYVMKGGQMFTTALYADVDGEIPS